MKKFLDIFFFRIVRSFYTSYLLIISTLIASAVMFASFLWITHGHKIISLESFALWLIVPVIVIILWILFICIAVYSNMDLSWFNVSLLEEDKAVTKRFIMVIAGFVIMGLHIFFVCCKYLSIIAGVGIAISLLMMFVFCFVGVIGFAREIDYEYSDEFIFALPDKANK